MAFKYDSYNHYYKLSQLTEFFEEVGELETVRKSDHLEYYNVPAAFDIETSSIYDNTNRKFATMYIWQFGLNGVSIIGRTWLEFKQFMYSLQKRYYLSHYKRLIVYVHNLAYEFQFMRKQIAWEQDSNGNDVVFSLKKRRPIYALAKGGIEFRCSYFLSNCSLSYIGAEMLFKYPVQKMVGDLDYNLVRHSATPLSKKEIEYCLNDIRVVMSFIQEKIENDGSILEIPLTNTGYVRKFTKKYCMGDFEEDEAVRRKRGMEYRAMMRSLQITSDKEYAQLKSAFAGGFTHASPTKSRRGQKGLPYYTNVCSFDLSSSYPYTMVSSYFPMSSSEFLGDIEYPEQFQKLIDNYCCLFTVTFYDLYQIFPWESYISVSKCTEKSEFYIAQNGRLCEADYVTINCTELDFDIISKIYGWSKIEVTNMRVYERGYLPAPFIMSILELYAAKTTLKGVPDKIVEYMIKKGMLNSDYGMAVTDIVRDDAIYCDGSWDSIEADAFSQLTKYNHGYTRFLFYPWGVWVTAHARHNLWEAIFEFGEDYIYADTDSIKGLNLEKHKRFFDIYNARVKTKLYFMCDWYGIDKNMVMPKTQDGYPKLIGVWEQEKNYAKFRTIGAKRYLYEYESGELGLTVSGVNKNFALPYLLWKYCNFDYDLCKLAYSTDPRLKEESKKAMKKLLGLHKNKSYKSIFKAFDDSLEIPPGYSGKSIHTYVDIAYATTVTDYMGESKTCFELSYTHLEPTGYFFSMSVEYLEYLSGVIISVE